MPDNCRVRDVGAVSIVICTDGRAKALENLLICLHYLEGPPFEVCVVAGPTEDGTAQVLSKWDGRVKVARNTERNLSVSRNIGIALADCQIVAFIDDDGLPEPEWLPKILRAFEVPAVAAAGGIVMDYTGTRPQYLYASADRLGNPDLKRTTPAEQYNFPYSFNFPYVQGTNSAFRRGALLSIGGFDEEYEFYLDETDVCCRLIDCGFHICQLSDAIVHHKFLPSAIRTDDRVTRMLFSILKNKLYFSLINNRGHYPISRALDDMTSFVREREADLRCHFDAGRVPQVDLQAFYRDVDHAWEVGLVRGLSGQRRLLTSALLDQYRSRFLPFPRHIPADGRDTFVFVSAQLPPDRTGGVGRHVRELSSAVAALGHQVHVVSCGDGRDRLDFEDGVWVHRTVVRDGFCREPTDVPANIWNWAHTALEVVRTIAATRPVTAVHAPIWNCEGVAVLSDRRFPLVTWLHTPLRVWMESHPHVAGDPRFRRDYARPMVRLEEQMLLECDAVHAISVAIVDEIEDKYGIFFDKRRLDVIHPGAADWVRLPMISVGPSPDGVVRLLFVGRLERRKGIDLLLEVIPELLVKYSQLYVDIVGNDAIPGPSGQTYRAEFENAVNPNLRDRVHFHGEVTDERLRGFYHDCDVFTAPSRFESFGLVLLEAMMFAKPVVASRVGGIVEVVQDGQTALLTNPGDVNSLAMHLRRLIENPALRRRLGEAGRRRYEAAFTPDIMANRVVALLRAARTRHDAVERVPV